ncbi:MAG: hypothetical protein MJ066_05975 [Clostridia bacterium]|nr:hypothetical protein [Clostridia bacterium]
MTEQEFDEYIKEHPQEAEKLRQIGEKAQRLTEQMTIQRPPVLSAIAQQTQAVTNEFVRMIASINEVMQQAGQKLKPLIEIMERRRVGLIELGIEEGKLTTAYSLFEGKIPEDLGLFGAIIDYAILLKAQKGYENLQLKDIAATITKRGGLLDSPYKEVLTTIFKSYINEYGFILDEFVQTENASISQIYAPNNKLANTITKIGLQDFDTLLQLDVTPSTQKNKIITDFSLMVDEENIKLTQAVTEYDRQVYNAITSLFVERENKSAGKVIFTAGQIFKILSGETTKAKKRPSPESLTAITKSIEKMSSIRVEINAAQELENYKKDLKSISLKSYLLATTGVTIVTNNGDIVTGWQLIDTPILYKYAGLCGNNEKGQIQSYKSLLLNVPNLSQTTQNTALKGYLINRILTIQYQKNAKKPVKKKLSNIISFDTLYEALGIDTAKTRTSASRIRSTTL